jgi:hypothetical protein
LAADVDNDASAFVRSSALATQKTFAAFANATGAMQAARTMSTAFIGISRLWQICKSDDTFKGAK